MLTQKATEIGNAFGKYIETAEKSIIEKFTIQEIEAALLQYHLDKGRPFYEAMESRILELKEEQGRRENSVRKDNKEAKEEKRHKITVMLTITSICIAFMGGIAWNIIYNLFVYPPKYVLDKSSLSFGRYFNEWIVQEQKENINIYDGDVNFVLHFVLRNIHRGEGEISKPLLVITAKNSNMEYMIKPKTGSISSKGKKEDITSFTPVDLSRAIHVGPYGIIDEFFEYSIKGNSEIISFLKSNKDRLQFKIRGYPYRDTNVNLNDPDVDYISIKK